MWNQYHLMKLMVIIEIAELTFSYISLCLDDPVITITGDNPFSHNVGNSFTDPDATAVDDLGNSLAQMQ